MEKFDKLIKTYLKDISNSLNLENFNF